MNVFTFSNEYSGGFVRQGGSGNETQESDRRERAMNVVTKANRTMMANFTPLVAKEYLSAIFRQRGVPSVDMFTREMISAFRAAVGLDSTVDDVLRRIVSVCKWSNHVTTVTMWTIEPVIATMCIYGNTMNLSEAKETYDKYLNVLDPLTTTSHSTTVVDNQIKGRWAGWITWMHYMNTGVGNPDCISCNMCGPSMMFAVHKKGSKMFHLMMTPESIRMLSGYSASLYANMGATATLITHSSTRLKIQSTVGRSRSTCLTLYGNGSMQFTGSRHEITFIYSCMTELMKMVMNSEMVAFLSTMRKIDKVVF